MTNKKKAYGHATLNGVKVETQPSGRAFVQTKDGNAVNRLYSATKQAEMSQAYATHSVKFDAKTGTAEAVENAVKAMIVRLPNTLADYAGKFAEAMSCRDKAKAIIMAVAQAETFRAICGIYNPAIKAREFKLSADRVYNLIAGIRAIPEFREFAPIIEAWHSAKCGIVRKGKKVAFTISPEEFAKSQAKEENQLAHFKYVKPERERPEQNAQWLGRATLAFVKRIDALAEIADGMNAESDDTEEGREFLKAVAERIARVVSEEIAKANEM
jgi:hypothetical protein